MPGARRDRRPRWQKATRVSFPRASTDAHLSIRPVARGRWISGSTRGRVVKSRPRHLEARELIVRQTVFYCNQYVDSTLSSQARGSVEGLQPCLLYAFATSHLHLL